MGMKSYEKAKADFDQVLSLSKNEKKFKKVREQALQCLKTISAELGNDSDEGTDDDMPSLVFDTDEEEESSPQQSISKEEKKKKKKKKKKRKRKKKKKEEEEEEETDDDMPDLMFEDVEEEKDSAMLSGIVLWKEYEHVSEEAFMNEIRSIKNQANQLFAARKLDDAMKVYVNLRNRITARESTWQLSNEANVIRQQVASNIIACLLKMKKYDSCCKVATHLLQCDELDISLKIKALYRRGKARWELKQLKGAKSDFEQVVSLSEDEKKFRNIRAGSIKCLKSICAAESFVTNEPEVVSPEEAIRQLQSLKSKGNQLFKQKRYEEARKVYQQGLQTYVMSLTMPPELTDLRRPLSVKMMANLSACELKLKDYNACIRSCDQLMQGVCEETIEMPIKIKTLYRRGKSKFELQQLEDAKLDFESVISLTDESQDLKKKFRSIREESIKCLKSISGEESTDEDMPELDFSDGDDI